MRAENNISRLLWRVLLTALLSVVLHRPVTAQRVLPLASGARSMAEYESLIRSGLRLASEDSAIVLYGQMKGMFTSLPRISQPIGKCGTQIALEANAARTKLPSGLQFTGLDSLPPHTDSIVSPSGRFTIFYNKTGIHAVTQEYLDSIAHFEDEAYSLEIVELGYPKPPYSGPDSTWHIYLYDLGSGGIYGFTAQLELFPFASSRAGLPLYHAYNSIDNDFAESSYPTHGLDAARITVFHEFHHIIQFGCFGLAPDDINFREMTSVWMEMRSTPLVKDYLQYVGRFFQHIDQRFDRIEDGGYSEGIWMQFLQERYGDDIVRSVWEFYSQKNGNFPDAFDSILSTYRSTFCSEYQRFATAVYYSGKNYQGSSPFPDARIFPEDLLKTTVLLSGTPSVFYAFLPMSLAVCICGYGSDTSVITVSRSTDVSFIAIDTVISKTPLSFENHGQFPETFCDSISLPTLVATKVFPQPFIIGSDRASNVLNILASTLHNVPSTVDLNIYSASGSLIRHFQRATDAKLQTIASDPFGGSWYVEWDGTDDASRVVPSGVYYYSVYVDGQRTGGKFVVLRKN